MAKENTGKKPIFKKWWFWLIVVIVILGFAFGGGDSKEDSKTEKVSSSSEQKDTNSESKDDAKKEDVKDTYEVGDEVKMGDNVLVVNSVKRTKGGEFDSPKSGYEYVIINVTVKNDGKEKISYNPYDFELANSEGNVTDITYISADGVEDMESGDLMGGGKVSGDLVYEEPKGDKGLVLYYQPSFWSEDAIKINIK